MDTIKVNISFALLEDMAKTHLSTNKDVLDQIPKEELIKEFSLSEITIMKDKKFITLELNRKLIIES